MRIYLCSKYGGARNKERSKRQTEQERNVFRKIRQDLTDQANSMWVREGFKAGFADEYSDEENEEDTEVKTLEEKSELRNLEKQIEIENKRCAELERNNLETTEKITSYNSVIAERSRVQITKNLKDAREEYDRKREETVAESSRAIQLSETEERLRRIDEQNTERLRIIDEKNKERRDRKNPQTQYQRESVQDLQNEIEEKKKQLDECLKKKAKW